MSSTRYRDGRTLVFGHMPEDPHAWTLREEYCTLIARGSIDPEWSATRGDPFGTLSDIIRDDDAPNLGDRLPAWAGVLAESTSTRCME